MQVHSLDFDDFSEDEYSLIGIHTALEDFKLAYLLNKKLGTKFHRFKENSATDNIKDSISFSVYNYNNNEYDSDWFLIANSVIKENIATANELLLSSETKSYLIPEKKKVDYFLKMSGNIEYNVVIKTIDEIKTIDQIITSYFIDKDTLKSKDFLIF